MVGCKMECSFNLFSSADKLYFVYLGRISSFNNQIYPLLPSLSVFAPLRQDPSPPYFEV